jgi:hypothetical protein
MSWLISAPLESNMKLMCRIPSTGEHWRTPSESSFIATMIPSRLGLSGMVRVGTCTLVLEASLDPVARLASGVIADGGRPVAHAQTQPASQPDQREPAQT